MNNVCQPLPPSVANELLQLVAKALCDRPNEKPPVREARTQQMAHTVLGFEPRDGLEYMLATMVFGHFHLIVDSMRDALRGQMDSVKAKTKTTIVSLDRTMLGLIRELRLTRHRPISERAEETWRQAQDAMESLDWVAEWAGMPPAAQAAPAPEPTATATQRPASSRDRVPVPPQPGNRPVAAPVQTPPRRPNEGSTEQHVAAFQDALTAMAETLAEARALDGAKPNGKATTGD